MLSIAFSRNVGGESSAVFCMGVILTATIALGMRSIITTHAETIGVDMLYILPREI